MGTLTKTEPTVLAPERRTHFDWVPGLCFKPAHTLRAIAEHSAAAWLLPLLLISIFALAAVFAAGPVRQAAALNSGGNLPADFQYWPPEQQAQYQQSQAARSGPLFVYVLPAVSALAGVWLGWFVLSALLHLLLTLAGSRASMTAYLNLVGWASLPLALRYIVQGGYALIEKQQVTMAGLSGFAPVGEGFVPAYLGALLVFIDIYFLWQVVLLFVGARPTTGLSNGKVTANLILSLVILLLLSALPGYLITQLSGLSFVRPFFF